MYNVRVEIIKVNLERAGWVKGWADSLKLQWVVVSAARPWTA